MGASVSNLTSQLNGNLAASFAAADRNSRVFGQGIGRLASGIQSVGTGFATYLTLPLLGLGGAALKMAGDLEVARVSFTTMLGSAEKANEVLSGLQKFAADTPFEFPEIQSAAKSLLAFGITAEQLQPTLRSLGDISAGIGAPIGEIAEIFGKAKTQGRLFAEDINQLTGRGIPIIQELAKQFGVTEGAVKDLAKDGKVGFNDLQTAFTNLTAKGAKFGGLMEAQSKTLPGLFSSLKDSAGQALGELGEELSKAFNLKGVISNLTGFISRAVTAFKALDPGVKQFIITFAAAAAAFGPVLIAVSSGIKAFGALNLALTASLGPVALVVAGVAAAAFIIVRYGEDIKKALTDSGIWQTVTGYITAFGTVLKDVFNGAVNLAKSIWASFGADILRVGKAAFEAVGAIIKFQMDLMKSIITGVVGVVGAIWAKFGDSIKTIAKAAFEGLGGIFKAGTAVLSGTFKVITGVLTGDFAKIGQGLQNIGAGLWNGLISIFSSGIGIVGELFAKFISLFGADELAQKIRDGVAATANALNGYKQAIKDAQVAAGQGIDVAITANPKPPGTATPPAPGAGTGGSGGSGNAKQKEKEAKTALEEAEEALRKLQARIENATFRGIEIPPALLAQYEELKLKVEAAKKALDGFKPVDLNGLKPVQSTATPDRVGQAFNELSGQIQLPTLPNIDAFVNTLKENEKKFNEAKESFRASLGIARGQLVDAGVGLLAGFGEAIGRGENPLKSALRTILGFIGDFAIKLGSAILLMGKLESVAALIPGLAPLFALTGPAKIAAGAGLVIGGGIIKGLAAFANGGLVYGPTLGLIGEGRGTNANNPEVIAPLDRLKSMIGGTGQNINLSGEFVLDGRLMKVAIQRAEREEGTYR